ncbi:MAG TPA: PaaI family thioesterase [Syntrophales bacterium]|nr:PaaI family thioesterase [Syntrophales bacterium]
MPTSDGRNALLRPDVTAEKLNERGKEYLPGFMGIEVVSLEPGRLRSRMVARQELMAPNGFLHAASVTGLADTACGYATVAHLPKGAVNFTTIELKLNFLGTAQKEEAIACEAELKHAGRTTQVWDAVVTAEASGRPIALFRCTQMILWPKGAAA